MVAFTTTPAAVQAGLDYVLINEPVKLVCDNGKERDLLWHCIGDDSHGPLYRADGEGRFVLCTDSGDYDRYLEKFPDVRGDHRYDDFLRIQHERHASLLNYLVDNGVVVAVHPPNSDSMTDIVRDCVQAGFFYRGQYEILSGDGYVRFTLEDAWQSVLSQWRKFRGASFDQVM